MAKDTFYFSHDYNARNDPKVRKLISVHKMEGYGIFWAIVEDLYQNANALPLDYDLIAFDLRTNCDTVKSIINDFDLFVIDGNDFGSNSVEARLNERNEKSGKARKSAFKRWNKVKQDANALQTQYDSNAIKESKGKESKIDSDDIFGQKHATVETNGEKTPRRVKVKKITKWQDDEDFVKFFTSYHTLTRKPRTDHDATFIAWKKLTADEKVKAMDESILRKYSRTKDNPDFLKKARTYLTDKNFNDEYKRELLPHEMNRVAN